jgi:hypothetical protein
LIVEVLNFWRKIMISCRTCAHSSKNESEFQGVKSYLPFTTNEMRVLKHRYLTHDAADKINENPEKNV